MRRQRLARRARRLAEVTSDPWRVVQRLNAAWHTNDLAALPALAVARGACVESYRAFVTSASGDDYVVGTPTVDLVEGLRPGDR